MNDRVQLISQAEYARRRGVAKSAVAKAVAEGRISLIDGKVDPAVADIQWARNTRARADSGRAVAAAGQGEGQAPASVADAPVAPETGAAAPAQQGAYADARARRETADAETAEINLAKLRGQLVARDRAERGAFDAFRALRDAIMAAPQRAAPKVIGMTDARDIEGAMTTELRKAFEGWEAKLLEWLPQEGGR